jgi:hypothetical protein
MEGPVMRWRNRMNDGQGSWTTRREKVVEWMSRWAIVGVSKEGAKDSMKRLVGARELMARAEDTMKK